MTIFELMVAMFDQRKQVKRSWPHFVCDAFWNALTHTYHHTKLHNFVTICTFLSSVKHVPDYAKIVRIYAAISEIYAPIFNSCVPCTHWVLEATQCCWSDNTKRDHTKIWNSKVTPRFLGCTPWFLGWGYIVPLGFYNSGNTALYSITYRQNSFTTSKISFRRVDFWLFGDSE